MLKVVQDSVRKQSFRLDLLPQWIKRAYYELLSLKIFADDGLAKAMAVISMDTMPFATDVATDLQYQVLTKLFYKFLTSLESMADADRDTAVIKATTSGGIEAFVGCQNSLEALKVVNFLKRATELPVADVSGPITS